VGHCQATPERRLSIRCHLMRVCFDEDAPNSRGVKSFMCHLKIYGGTKVKEREKEWIKTLYVTR
jgi:hypothetical protein